jgi:hypothetical protein
MNFIMQRKSHETEPSGPSPKGTYVSSGSCVRNSKKYAELSPIANHRTPNAFITTDAVQQTEVRLHIRKLRGCIDPDRVVIELGWQIADTDTHAHTAHIFKRILSAQPSVIVPNFIPPIFSHYHGKMPKPISVRSAFLFSRSAAHGLSSPLRRSRPWRLVHALFSALINYYFGKKGANACEVGYACRGSIICSYPAIS